MLLIGCCMLAIIAPFTENWWAIGGALGYALFIITYGPQVMNWCLSFMEEEQQQLTITVRPTMAKESTLVTSSDHFPKTMKLRNMYLMGIRDALQAMTDDLIQNIEMEQVRVEQTMLHHLKVVNEKTDAKVMRYRFFLDMQSIHRRGPYIGVANIDTHESPFN